MKVARGILLAGLLCVVGCGYGPVSDTAYQYSKALYNISSRRLSDRLADVEAQALASQQAGEISQQEAKWLVAVIDNAEQQRWEKAMKASRRIMEDQVKYD